MCARVTFHHGRARRRSAAAQRRRTKSSTKMPPQPTTNSWRRRGPGVSFIFYGRLWDGDRKIAFSTLWQWRGQVFRCNTRSPYNMATGIWENFPADGFDFERSVLTRSFRVQLGQFHPNDTAHRARRSAVVYFIWNLDENFLQFSIECSNHSFTVASWLRPVDDNYYYLPLYQCSIDTVHIIIFY